MITCFLRTLILYFTIIFCLRVMGKRQLGELHPSELVTSILISDLAAVPMQDLGIPLLQGIIPIITLFCVELLISVFSSRSVKIRSFFNGRTSVLIKNGRINQEELKRQRINVVELLEELRLKDVFDPRGVGSAYLETNGSLSVRLMAGEQPVTAAQLGIDTSNAAELYMTIVAQGRVITANLEKCGRDEKWLASQLAANKVGDVRDVYLMVLDNNGDVMLVPKERFNPAGGVKEG